MSSNSICPPPTVLGCIRDATADLVVRYARRSLLPELAADLVGPAAMAGALLRSGSMPLPSGWSCWAAGRAWVVSWPQLPARAWRLRLAVSVVAWIWDTDHVWSWPGQLAEQGMDLLDGVCPVHGGGWAGVEYLAGLGDLIRAGRSWRRRCRRGRRAAGLPRFVAVAGQRPGRSSRVGRRCR
jgi:hypothetical protein